MMERSLNSIAENLRRIRADIADTAAACGRDPAEIRLMAVTKTVSAEFVNHAIACGVDLLGENRAQELLSKYDDYDKKDVDIHFIGHLQTNKVRQIAGKVSMVHSVDSIKLAQEISRQSETAGVTTDVLIEVNVGGESSKSGVEPEAAEALARELAGLTHIRLRGLMTIPPYTGNPADAEKYFYRMNRLLVDIQGKNIDNISMDVLSMGMSEDYKEAIRHGATILRLGSAVFGAR